MALGNSEGTGNSKFIALKQKASATDTPRFAIAEKNAEGKWVEASSYNFIEGMINKAYIEEKEFKPGKKDKMFVLDMEDGDEQYKVTLPHGGLTYLILNSLATNPNSLDKYKITVVKKQDGKYWNAKGYVNVNGEKDGLKWHTDMKATPRAEPIMVNGVHFEVNGEKQFDRGPVRKWWEDFFTTHIASKLTGGNVSSANTNIFDKKNKEAEKAQAQATNANTSTGNAMDDDSDLPF